MSDAGKNVRAHLDAWRDALIETHTRRAHVMFALQKLREHSGLTLREAARRAGISAATLSLAERAELDLSVEVADRVLRVLEAATTAGARQP